MSTREFSEPAGKGEVVGSWREVLLAFLRLGLTSFGGPVAHIGYFRDEFVVRRHWLDDRAYADLVALCSCSCGRCRHGSSSYSVRPVELRSPLSDALRGLTRPYNRKTACHQSAFLGRVSGISLQTSATPAAANAARARNAAGLPK